MDSLKNTVMYLGRFIDKLDEPLDNEDLNWAANGIRTPLNFHRNEKNIDINEIPIYNKDCNEEEFTKYASDYLDWLHEDLFQKIKTFADNIENFEINKRPYYPQTNPKSYKEMYGESMEGYDSDSDADQQNPDFW